MWFSRYSGGEQAGISRSAGGCYSEDEGRQEHTPFRAQASSGPAEDAIRRPKADRATPHSERQRVQGVRGVRPTVDKRRSPWQTLSVRDFRRTAATYSPSWWASTIGADELNGSVRDGKRWILIALTTAIYYLRDHSLGSVDNAFLLSEERVRAISTGRLCHRWLYTSRLSTSWSTTTL